MGKERTLVIIKPHIFLDNDTQRITGIIADMLSRYLQRITGIIADMLSRYLQRGLSIIAINSIFMLPTRVEEFYCEHIGSSFFNELCEAMVSGYSLMIVLEGEDAIQKVREINGATNPLEAKEGTLRKLYGRPEKGPNNAVHGSDSVESAEREIAYFFPELSSCPQEKVSVVFKISPTKV